MNKLFLLPRLKFYSSIFLISLAIDFIFSLFIRNMDIGGSGPGAFVGGLAAGMLWLLIVFIVFILNIIFIVKYEIRRKKIKGKENDEKSDLLNQQKVSPLNEVINNNTQVVESKKLVKSSKLAFKGAAISFIVNLCFLPALGTFAEFLSGALHTGFVGYFALFMLGIIAIVGLPISWLVLFVISSFYYYFSDNEKKFYLLAKINLILIVLAFVVLFIFNFYNPDSTLYQRRHGDKVGALRDRIEAAFPNINCEKLANNEKMKKECYDTILLLYTPERSYTKCFLKFKDKTEFNNCIFQVDKYFFEDDFCSKLGEYCYVEYFYGDVFMFFKHYARPEKLDAKICLKITNLNYPARNNCLYYALNGNFQDATSMKETVCNNKDYFPESKEQCEKDIDQYFPVESKILIRSGNIDNKNIISVACTNTMQRGTVTTNFSDGSIKINFSSCNDDGSLKQYYCDRTKEQGGVLNFEDNICPDWSKCKDGACIANDGGAEFVPIYCLDSEKEQNYKQTGSVINTFSNGSTQVYFDSCNADGTLKEYYCDRTKDQGGVLKYSNNIICPDGLVCKDGACVIN